jgi:protein-tyrosine phosphatase
MDRFSIAFICTGNRFRSALAEAFVHRLTRGLPVLTQSYGTLQLGAAPALPEAIVIARACGIDLSEHSARCVRGASLGSLDLVLGFDDDHVRQAVVDGHAPRRRSFTVRELVRLLAEVTPPDANDPLERARVIVEQAAEQRNAHPTGPSDGVRDPLGAPWKVYLETAAEVQQLSVQLVASLFGVDARELPPVPPRLKKPRRWRR